MNEQDGYLYILTRDYVASFVASESEHSQLVASDVRKSLEGPFIVTGCVHDDLIDMSEVSRTFKVSSVYTVTAPSSRVCGKSGEGNRF